MKFINLSVILSIALGSISTFLPWTEVTFQRAYPFAGSILYESPTSATLFFWLEAVPYSSGCSVKMTKGASSVAQSLTFWQNLGWILFFAQCSTWTILLLFHLKENVISNPSYSGFITTGLFLFVIATLMFITFVQPVLYCDRPSIGATLRETTIILPPVFISIASLVFGITAIALRSWSVRPTTIAG